MNEMKKWNFRQGKQLNHTNQFQRKKLGKQVQTTIIKSQKVLANRIMSYTENLQKYVDNLWE